MMLLSPEVQEGDQNTRDTTKPRTLDDFVGQSEIIRPLKKALESANKRHEPLDHCLLSGPPGTGKSLLGELMAEGAGAILSCPAMKNGGELYFTLHDAAKAKARYVILDEVHALGPRLMEVLYIVMDRGYVPNISGGVMTPFNVSLVATTTKPGACPAPFRDRFGIQFSFRYYDLPELVEMSLRGCTKLEIEANSDALQVVADRSRGTPRVALRLLKRIRDYSSTVSGNDADEILREWGIFPGGLTRVEQRYLDVVKKTFHGGPVGLRNIAAVLGEDPKSLEQTIEPFLIRAGRVLIVSGGRVAI